MNNAFTGSLNGVTRICDARSRAICAENRSGGKGQGGMAAEGVSSDHARDLGQGWKVSPFVRIPAGATETLADITGPGVIRHIWVVDSDRAQRTAIFRVYWEGLDKPSIECPIGDFFACGKYQPFSQLTSLAVCINPHRGMNCYWEMPFRRRCVMTLENTCDSDIVVYYQVDYTLCDVPADAGYFHAQFRRVNPLPYKEVYTILDGVRGHGQYVGTYLLWGVNNNGWWGEGEIKFYLDGDTEFPTICGTGTEDYFCGAYNFDVDHRYTEFCTPYSGLAAVFRGDGLYESQQRFSMYRWHLPDPIYFSDDLRVTIQALGWRSGGRYLPLQDDISSVAYWYQSEPFTDFPPLPDKDSLEII